MILQRTKQLIPFLILMLLLAFLWHELLSSQNAHASSGMVGEAVPAFSLPQLSNPKLKFTSTELPKKVVILNVWASWCSACKMEHDMLMKIKNQYHVPIYGILYKDDPSDALQWLIKKGNPYVNVGVDSMGDAAIDLGIYGTPESFVVSPDGKILYRQTGVIDQETWDSTIYPIIKRYEKIAS